MVVIQRWHHSNTIKHADELEHLLRVARHDNVHAEAE
jgi:hypothetical protein